MSNFPRTAIILAAGVGRRLGNTPDDRPKCMLPFDGRTLLAHQVEALRGVGVTHVVLVVGHQATRVMAHARSLPGVFWTFIHNPEFATSNTLYSLARAASHLEHGALVLNGDVLFGSSLLVELLAPDREAAMAVEVRPTGEEEVKVQVDADDRVIGLSKAVAVADSLGEAVGISVFRADWGQAFASRLVRFATRDEHRHSYYEAALLHVAAERPVHVVRLAGSPVIEIDFAEDYTRALTEIAPQLRSDLPARLQQVQ